jgi:hypothetical protein
MIPSLNLVCAESQKQTFTTANRARSGNINKIIEGFAKNKYKTRKIIAKDLIANQRSSDLSIQTEARISKHTEMLVEM